jgi:ATP-dependent exoDNAse (exonuclease V) beta subunit
MSESAFSEEYYNELVMSHVDGINLLYVAITRAAKELYIYIEKNLNPKKGHKESNDINDTTPLIINAISTMCKAQDERNETNELTHVRYTYGAKISHHTPKQHSTETNSTILTEYPTSIPDIAVCYPSHRYIEEGLTPGTTQCRTGIMLHRIFEKAESIDDLYNAIKRMSLDCLIDNETAERLRNNIDQAMQDKCAKEWFSDRWDDIKTEAEILQNGIVRRPDRVMIAGKRAIVVDYKFGDKRSNVYRKQMSEYMRLLADMGKYSQIEGYVWYISLGEIENVEL